ncbi:hypothetical protein Hdeb2414_s0016g00492361 [Helianthus debilis subsp. tardiflorus]
MVGSVEGPGDELVGGEVVAVSGEMVAVGSGSLEGGGGGMCSVGKPGGGSGKMDTYNGSGCGEDWVGTGVWYGKMCSLKRKCRAM